MEVLNNEVLTMLIQERQGPCLSIFTPTHRQWNELNQDMLRFRNQLKEAEKILSDNSMSSGEINRFLEPAYRLAEDREFWNYQKDGLAVYISENEFYEIKSPFNFPAKIYLNNRFYTKHLLPVYNGDRDFFILSLDVHNIRLFRAYHFNIREIDLGNIPVNIEDALGIDKDREKSLQFRTEISTGNTHRANFHGHGVRTDAAMRKKDIARFFEMVNEGLINILKNEKSPLILAGVEQSFPLYREANKYPNLYKEYLQVDVDFIDPNELYDRANTLLDPYFNDIIEKDLIRYGNSITSGRASDSIEDILKAAYDNRVSVLFVNPEVELWGKFDKEKYKTILHNSKQNGDEDLVDLAATQTLLRNGTIYTLSKEKMPNENSVAALYRY
jgi:hypothetical protein